MESTRLAIYFAQAQSQTGLASLIGESYYGESQRIISPVMAIPMQLTQIRQNECVPAFLQHLVWRSGAEIG